MTAQGDEDDEGVGCGKAEQVVRNAVQQHIPPHPGSTGNTQLPVLDLR